MATDTDSGDEALHTADEVTSGAESGAAVTGGLKQISVADLMRRVQDKKKKRPAPSRSQNSPPDTSLPGAKRRSTETSAPVQVSLDPDYLIAIQAMIDSATAQVITAMNSKFKHFEQSLSALEAESMEKELEIKQLKEKLAHQERTVELLEERVEGIDANRRLSSLILTCADFEIRHQNEDIESRIVTVLNKHLPELKLTISDIQAGHRLQTDQKVIVKFVRRSVRDRVYESRFSMFASNRQRSGPGAIPDRRMAPLYIAEQLTASNNAIYQELLRARRAENGALVSSVFSRRGVVWCKMERGGRNIRVPDESHLRNILRGARFPPPGDWGSSGRRRPAGGGAAAAASLRPPPVSSAQMPCEGRGGSPRRGVDGGAGGAGAAEVSYASLALPVGGDRTPAPEVGGCRLPTVTPVVPPPPGDSGVGSMEP